MEVNAIIMAAGMGTRLKPITNNTPKPLVKVNGIPMIENIIQNLIACYVQDITIVVGYLADRFEYLKDKYNVNIIKNVDYNVANNISSLYYAREKLKKTIILDGDQIITNNKIIRTDFDKSGYVCWWEENFANEWMLHLDENNKIVKCFRNGSDKAWELKGLSFWTEEDSRKLKQYLVEEYEIAKNNEIYWDDIAMFKYNESFDLYGYKIDKEDIIEIDGLNDLIKIDPSYERRI